RQMSPLEQIKSGIKSKDITCLAGLQLITKAEDGTSVCVKPDTAQILIQRGWARQESNNHGIQAQSKITLNESNVSPLSKEPFINQRWGDEIKVNNETEASQIAGYLVKFPTKLPENYKLQLSVVDPITPANKYVYLFYSKSPISDTMRWHDFLNAGGITINIHHNQYQNPSPDPWATLIIGLQHMGYKDAHEVTINGYKAWVGSNHTRFFNGWHVEDPSELEYLANGTDVQIAGDFTTNELIDMGQSMYP
ncbi:MAG TPA: hypothetical protein VJR22_06265, partial [Candidatus Nitrosotalea sp.]|nr:hypothetical protein [Candidatus Nitrosotalea sp.]